MATFASTEATPVNPIYDSTPTALQAGGLSFESYTHIGLRPSQEDRLVLCPTFQREDAHFLAVFDGTVGPDAAHFCQQNIVNVMLEQGGCFDTAEIFDVTGAADPTTDAAAMDRIASKVAKAMISTFLETDRRLIAHCAQYNLHYASSTGVSAFIWRNLLTVAHVGDSKALIAKMVDGDLQPEWLTVDHKPHMPKELERIERSGGSLAWLHGNKPYIRGGDFHERQVRGEHPKQLNYSRAFGGKDLKMYGLVAEPDVSHFQINPDDRVVILGSDGLWDVVGPKVACEVAMLAHREGRSAARDLVEQAISDMPACGVRDNVTVLTVFFDAAGGITTASSAGGDVAN
jgi:serine/threonine protein phosphatase PrpC